MQQIFIILALILSISIVETKIYHVTGLIVEGARYPWNDLYDGGEFKDKWGQLTPVGMRQH